MSQGINRPRRGFYWRAFVTFYILLSILLLAASGVVLYIAPPGRVANWSRWAILWLDKRTWQAVHTVLASLFLAAVIFHLYFNWRVITGYIRLRIGEGMRRKWELAAAASAFVVVMALTIAGAPPFQSIVTFGEGIKQTWSTQATEPPVPHAEEWTLAKAAEEAGIPVEKAASNLAGAGIEVKDPRSSTLEDLAANSGLTPQEVFKKARGKPLASNNPATAQGGGWGRRTVAEAAEKDGIPIERALARLAAKGINASPDSTLRELAEPAGLTPMEVLGILRDSPAPHP